MMEEIFFTKMHGLGNDYIYIDCLDSVPRDPERLSVLMSDRHTGVGGDGIILICRSDVADFKMRMFNADGSEGKMCGNASRCIAKYVHDKGLTDKEEIRLETLSGIKILKLHLNGEGAVESVTVDMGAPELSAKLVPVKCDAEQMINRPVYVNDEIFDITAVSMGNPHGVIFLDKSPSSFEIERRGRALETHSMWPERANIEFAHVVDEGRIEMRVWERGSGETMACGTGACATAVAAHKLGKTGRRVIVELRGGELLIDWDEASGHVFMTGPAETVMEGRYFCPDLKD